MINYLERLRAEMSRSDAKYGDYASAHEAYGVLLEEVAEIFDAIRLRPDDPEREVRIREESIQVASVALRLAQQIARVRR